MFLSTHAGAKNIMPHTNTHKRSQLYAYASGCAALTWVLYNSLASGEAVMYGTAGREKQHFNWVSSVVMRVGSHVVFRSMLKCASCTGERAWMRVYAVCGCVVCLLCVPAKLNSAMRACGSQRTCSPRTIFDVNIIMNIICTHARCALLLILSNALSSALLMRFATCTHVHTSKYNAYAY